MNTNPYAARLKALMKLSINRLKMLQQKKAALNKQSRRNLSTLLEAGKVDACRIRIENLWQDDVHVELLEILELYCELVLARSSRITNQEIRDERVEEAVHVLLYASQFVDVKELVNLKPLIGHLVTKEYVEFAMENTNGIPDAVVQKIHVELPSSELVDSYMLEICKAYEITVPGIYEAPEPQPASVPEPAPAEAKAGTEPASTTAESAKAPAAAPALPSTPSAAPVTKTNTASGDPSTDDLWARFAALKKQ